MHAYVTSKLDYCNALLVGIHKKHLQKLLRVQHVEARLVTCSEWREESGQSIMKSLHWLPIPERITLKVLVMTYKALNGLAPIYLSDLREVYQPNGDLRSAYQNQLVQHSWHLDTYGERAFSNYAPVLWNLPISI